MARAVANGIDRFDDRDGAGEAGPRAVFPTASPEVLGFRDPAGNALLRVWTDGEADVPVPTFDGATQARGFAVATDRSGLVVRARTRVRRFEVSASGAVAELLPPSSVPGALPLGFEVVPGGHVVSLWQPVCDLVLHDADAGRTRVFHVWGP